MIAHSATPHGANQPALPNQPFFSWLRTNTTLFISQIIGLLSVVSAPIALNYYSHSLPSNIELQTIGHLVIYAHVLFLVVFISVLIRSLDKIVGRYRARLVHEKLKGQETDREQLEVYASRQVARFKRRFLWFWCAMLFLYLIFAIEPLFAVAPADCLIPLPAKSILRTELFPLLSFVLNNLSLTFVFCCFSVLYLPINTVTTGERSQKGVWKRFFEFMRALVKRFSRQDLNAHELCQRTMVVLFVIGITALTVTFPLLMLTKIGERTNWSEYPAAFGALSGTINAIVLALLVARLDSKLIGLPSWLICMLYFYAGVQPMFVVFELHPEVYAGIKTAVLLVVFVFKIYFFLIIVYTLQTGRMFNYFFCSPLLNEHVKALKQPLPEESALQTPAAVTAEGNPAEQSHGVSSDQPENEVVENLPVSSVTTSRVVKWFENLVASVLTNWKKAPRTSETASGTTLNEGGLPSNPDQKDPRAIWSMRVGVSAMVVFAGLLLSYVSLPEDYKHWLDFPGLSNYVVEFHLGLLLVICVVVVNAWFKEARTGYKPSDELRSKVRADVRFKLSEPGSLEARAKKFEALSNRIDNQFRSFTHYFRLFWILLLFLYVAMWLSGHGETPERLKSKDCVAEAEHALPIRKATPNLPSRSIPNDETAFSRMSLPWVETAFVEHSPTPSKAKTDETKQVKNSEPSSEPQLSVIEMPPNVKYAFVFFVLNNLMVLVLFWCFTILYVPADDGKFDERHRLLRNYSLLICVLLTALIPLLAIILKGNKFTLSDAEKIPTVLGAVGGTLNAVAFALLIARLDSRIIGLRSPMVAVLYAYAAVQPLFITFNQPSNLLKFVATSAMIAAFMFKISLVLMIGHIRRSGGLIDYLWFFPVLHNSVNSIFGNQFEIKAYSPKPGLYTFSIFNKNIETYRAAEIYPSRSQCDFTIRTLVEAMRQRGSYSHDPLRLQGIYWIQVKSGELLLCESKGLSSLTEVAELINESIEKVPYCKYHRG